MCLCLLFLAVFRESRGTSAQNALVGWFMLNCLIAFVIWIERSEWYSHLPFILELSFVSFLLLFSHEIKRVLSIFDIRPRWHSNVTEDLKDQQTELRQELSHAAESLSKKKEGALLVIQQRADLSDFLSGGVVIDSQVKASLIHAIFCHNGNDFHDGAVVIREGRIWQTKAFLPMPHSIKLSQQYGTRHLAAVGITDHTDAVVIVVSEERGTISIAYAGQLTEFHDRRSLESALEDHLI
jgi:diadenylate cyclase